MVQEFKHVVLVEGEYSRNIAPVDQYGYVDLRVAFESSSIPADITGAEGSFNGISEPESILGVPDDAFSAIRASKAVGDIAKSPEGGESA